MSRVSVTRQRGRIKSDQRVAEHSYLLQARERELFAAFDTLTAGTPGVLAPKEFEAAALRIMPELKPEQLRRLFKELDRDRDGFIDFLGFLQVSSGLLTPAVGRASGTHQPPAGGSIGVVLF